MGTLFFWVSKLTWSLLSPDSLLLILLCVACLLIGRGRMRWGKRVLGLVLVAFLVIGLFPVGEWILAPLEQRFPTSPDLPDQVDGIIVLGGAENTMEAARWDQVEVGEAGERFTAFVTLCRRYPQAQRVFSGGSGFIMDQTHKGADISQRLFADLGLDTSRILFERSSRNTFENVINTMNMVHPDANETWIVITSAWHMPRTMGIFARAHWAVIPYPVDHWTRPGHLLRAELNLAGHLSKLKTGIKEWIGLLVYYITGKTDSIFPGPD